MIGASDGAQGVEIVRRHRESLVGVLLDLTMPNMDGETAFREIESLRPDLPIVLMSDFDKGDAVARFAGKGLAGFLQKPFTVNIIPCASRASLRPRGASRPRAPGAARGAQLSAYRGSFMTSVCSPSLKVG